MAGKNTLVAVENIEAKILRIVMVPHDEALARRCRRQVQLAAGRVM